MKAFFASLFVSLFFVGMAQASVLEWDRNSETDLKDYQVWICLTQNCVVIKSASTLQPTTVPQTAVGLKPTFTIDLSGKEGSAAVTARDGSLNESELSVQVPFDFKAPSIPQNPHLR